MAPAPLPAPAPLLPPGPRFTLAAPATIPLASLNESISSCFTLLVYVPPDAQAQGLAQGRHARGHAFLLGDKAACKADAACTPWRSLEGTAARILLIFSHRGGLEMPGGGREAGEDLARAASRELEEETGTVLSRPLTLDDAVLVAVERKDARPRWLLFLRVVRSCEEFYSGKWGAQPMEMWGLVAPPLTVENLGKGPLCNGFPRALACLPPWQAELVVPMLVRGGVLSEDEAQTCARTADLYLAAGGARQRARKDDPPFFTTLQDALQHSLRELASGCGEPEQQLPTNFSLPRAPAQGGATEDAGGAAGELAASKDTAAANASSPQVPH